MFRCYTYLHLTNKKQEDFNVLEGDGVKFFLREEMSDLKLPFPWKDQKRFVDAGLEAYKDFVEGKSKQK